MKMTGGFKDFRVFLDFLEFVLFAFSIGLNGGLIDRLKNLVLDLMGPGGKGTLILTGLDG